MPLLPSARANLGGGDVKIAVIAIAAVLVGVHVAAAAERKPKPAAPPEIAFNCYLDKRFFRVFKEEDCVRLGGSVKTDAEMTAILNPNGPLEAWKTPGRTEPAPTPEFGTLGEPMRRYDPLWNIENTYGYPCGRIVSEGPLLSDGHYVVKCSNGREYKVYARRGQHPMIRTN